jgi:hypothetical protein
LKRSLIPVASNFFSLLSTITVGADNDGGDDTGEATEGISGGNSSDTDDDIDGAWTGDDGLCNSVPLVAVDEGLVLTPLIY